MSGSRRSACPTPSSCGSSGSTPRRCTSTPPTRCRCPDRRPGGSAASRCATPRCWSGPLSCSRPCWATLSRSPQPTHERVSTMLRARRVAFVAVLALMGGLALAGCRAQPGAAIYLGTARYTEKYVDELSDQITKLGYDRGNGRQTVAQWLVVRDLGKRIVADKHFPA